MKKFLCLSAIFFLFFPSSLWAASPNLEGAWSLSGHTSAGQSYQGILGVVKTDEKNSYYIYGKARIHVSGQEPSLPYLFQKGLLKGNKLIFKRKKTFLTDLSKLATSKEHPLQYGSFLLSKKGTRLTGTWKDKKRRGKETWKKISQKKSLPLYTYLTFRSRDTSRTMTVNFQTRYTYGTMEVRYDTQSRSGNPRGYSKKIKVQRRFIPGLGRVIHWAELKGLQPGQTYYFIAGSPQTGYGPEKKFRTVPQKYPLRFVTGGDMGTSSRMEKMTGTAGRLNPHVAIVGGDLAYANGKIKNYKIWDKWLKIWEKKMVTTDGRLIPMILAIGNHEVNGLVMSSKEKAPFYFNYFEQGGRSYFERTLGPEGMALILDSGHIHPHFGQQARWLKGKLSRAQSARQKFVVYHYPLYPSVRSTWWPYTLVGRRVWRPHFEKYKITAAFENHDHAYKRTWLLKDGKKVKKGGVLYLGDGCWGKGARKVKNREYLARRASRTHVWLVEVDQKKVIYKAVGKSGKVFDQIRYDLKKRKIEVKKIKEKGR